MEDFNISSKDLFAQFLSYNYGKKDLKCEVLFPDGTIIKDAKVSLKNGATILLVIVIHGVEFQDWISQRLENLKFKIIEKKTP